MISLFSVAGGHNTSTPSTHRQPYWARFEAQSHYHSCRKTSANTYREDTVVPRPEIPMWCHHACQRVNLEPLVLVVLEFVGHQGVWTLVIIACDHPADLQLAAAVALFRQLDVEQFVGEFRSVVVGIQNSNHDSGRRTQRWRSIIGHNYLRDQRRIKSSSLLLMTSFFRFLKS